MYIKEASNPDAGSQPSYLSNRPITSMENLPPLPSHAISNSRAVNGSVWTRFTNTMDLDCNFPIFASELERRQKAGHGYRVPCLSVRPKPQPKPHEDGEPEESLRLHRHWASMPQKLLNRILRRGLREQQQNEYLLTGQQKTPLLSFTLPNELWLQIIHQLPPETLWSFRQSSPLFFNLVNATTTLRKFHSAPGPSDRYVRFNIEAMSKSERDTAAKSLGRDMATGWRLPELPETYCASCTETLRRGEAHPAKLKLRQTRFCDGCKERHFCVFFPPESIKQYDSGATAELYCVGRSGTVTLCSHGLAPSLTWKEVEEKILYRHFKLSCQDTCHQPSPKKTLTLHGSACPRLQSIDCTNDGTSSFKFGWDRPILDIDPEFPPSIMNIRREVAKSIEGIFAQHKPCRHMVEDSQQLRAFAFSGLCKCFSDPSTEKVPRDPLSSTRQHGCSCRRKHYLECRECAATYSWHLKYGRITLSYRYEWDIGQPTSPAWIAMLDGGPKELGIFSQDNQYLLWCDDPSCATGMGRRWEEMIKEAVRLQRILYGKKKHKGVGYSRNWDILKSAHDESESFREDDDMILGGFELPLYLRQLKNHKDTKALLEMVFEAQVDINNV